MSYVSRAAPYDGLSVIAQNMGNRRQENDMGEQPAKNSDDDPDIAAGKEMFEEYAGRTESHLDTRSGWQAIVDHVDGSSDDSD